MGMVTLVQQHQQTEQDQYQKDRDLSNRTVVIECHEPEDCCAETTESPKDTALVIHGGDSLASSSTQCSEVENDDEEEEEETDTEDDEWIPDLPVPAVLQQHQQVTTADGNLVLPNADVSNFGEVRVKNSSNVHLGNKTFYKGPVTIKQFVYTNPVPIQANDAIKNDASPKTFDSTNAPDGTLTLRQKVLSWLWSWRCAAFTCVLTIILALVVATACVYITYNTVEDDDGISDNSANTSVSEGPIVENIRFIERNEWGAQPPSEPLTKMKLPVPYVIISHTATEGCTMQSECTFRVRFAQSFHIESRHWSDIAYNFLAGGDGYVYVGRNWDYMGAHAFGFNNISIGISFIGTFNTVKPNKRQLHAVQKLIDLGVKTKKIATNYKLLAHRQVSGTLSPGDALYGIIQTWPHWSPTP
ncbi:peptidoglycan-recognition protein LC [Halictus rubicundus]|uniref:peptidoglycan-recognition protein LC n=1 Tax=Halictus rubicundus TaxID=77578 RepID=UPI004035C2A7